MWLSVISLLCEVIDVLALCLASCVEVVVLEREELCTPKLVLLNSQWRFPV